MVLLITIVLGLFTGYFRARLSKHALEVPRINWIWLVPLAYLPQWIAFGLPATQRTLSDNWAAIALVFSEILLLLFCVVNLRQPGFVLLGLGLLLNLVVISLNGGLMPISPETASRINPGYSPLMWQAGERLGYGKDIIIDQSNTRFWWLSDTLVLPTLIWHRLVAFSLGDIFIALGAFWFCWALWRKPGQLINAYT
jgi:hypothetical protein